jgi:hypothetical protein
MTSEKIHPKSNVARGSRISSIRNLKEWVTQNLTSGFKFQDDSAIPLDIHQKNDGLNRIKLFFSW